MAGEPLRGRTGTPPVSARFDTALKARAAIEALENCGLDGDDIVLLDDAHELSARATRSVDWRLARNLVSHIGLGAARGIVLGALLGLCAAIVLFATTALGVREALFACEMVGVYFGGTLGAFVAFERAGTLSKAWPRTFEDDLHRTVSLGVYARDPRQRARARRVLDAQHPIEISDDGPAP